MPTASTLSRALLLLALLLTLFAPLPAAAAGPGTMTVEEVAGAGHRFFGGVSGNIAAAIEQVVSAYGVPSGYIMGEEASGAVIGGLRYGEGTLYVDGSTSHIFWQGPSLGFDVGGDGNRTMMLVYSVSRPEDLYRRFAGLNGSAYLVGGLGVTVLGYPRPGGGDMIVVPIRSGVGARLGIAASYLKFTPTPTWNPF